MHIKCSWCKKILVYDDKDPSVSHGICASCAFKALDELGITPNPFDSEYQRFCQSSRVFSDHEYS